MSVLIQLTNSDIEAVIDEKYEKTVGRYKWYFSESKRKVFSTCNKKINLSRFIVELEGIPVKKKFVIHKNKNVYDCRASNLIVVNNVTRTHRTKRIDNTSGFIGVTKCERKWVAKIMFNHQTKSLGRFTYKIHAAIAYNAALKKLPIPEEIKTYNKI